MTSLTVPAKGHAQLGASSASRWMACPGSVRLSVGMRDEESEHSKEGTAAHALAEICLRKNTAPDLYVGMEMEGVEVTEEMAENVAIFVDHCRTIAHHSSEVWVEHRFSLGQLNPPAPMFGTCDYVAYDQLSATLYVIDLKFGRGVLVEASNNPQLRYYALGALLTLGAKHPVQKIVMTIVQPRAAHPDGLVRSEEIGAFDLAEWAGTLLTAAQRTLDDDAPLAAGNHCRFCKAKVVCPEQRRLAQEIAQVEFANMPADIPPAPQTLPVEVLADLLTKLPILEQWTKDMYKEAYARLSRGDAVPGFKLVAKRANRKWRDEADAAQHLKELTKADLFDHKLKSPAQVSKTLGKKLFETVEPLLVERKSSGVSVAPEHDARAAVSVAAGEEFLALEAGDDL